MAYFIILIRVYYPQRLILSPILIFQNLVRANHLLVVIQDI
jgi:hypothetical protein